MLGLTEVIKKVMSIMTAYGQVGSIYITANTTNPATLFGGSWTLIKDRFMVGSGGGYTVMGTGGVATTGITLPSHCHAVRGSYDAGSNVSGSTHYFVWHNNNGGSRMLTTAAGGSGQHNNIPLYKAVYIWRRTA